MVASGAAIASATVTVRDKTGARLTRTTDTNGKYDADVSGLAPPFLLKVANGATTLYSVATEAGTVNIHPFTDMITRNWYIVGGKDVDTVFAAADVDPLPPSTAGIATIERAVRQVLTGNMVSANVNTTNFNLFTSPFDANHSGFDDVLDSVKVNRESGTVTIVAVGGSATAPLLSVAENATIVVPIPVSPTVADGTAPTKPAGLIATRNEGKVVLSWTASEDAVGVAGYRIYRGDTKIGTSAAPTFADSNAPATGASYSVEAFDLATNTSVRSDSAPASDTVTASDSQAPSTPELTATAQASGDVSLSWTPSTDNVAISGYQVLVNGAVVTTTAALTQTYSVTGLTGGTSYVFGVKALDTSNNASTLASKSVSPSYTYSLASLKGNYYFLGAFQNGDASGSVAPAAGQTMPNPKGFAVYGAIANLDGSGNWTYSDGAQNTDGVIETYTGTVATDGAFTLNGGKMTGYALDNGKSIRTARTRSGLSPLVMIAERKSGTYTAASLSGNYAQLTYRFSLTSTQPTMPAVGAALPQPKGFSVHYGTNTFDGMGGTSSTSTNNIDGTITTSTNPATYTVANDGAITTVNQNTVNGTTNLTGTGSITNGGQSIVRANITAGQSPQFWLTLK